MDPMDVLLIAAVLIVVFMVFKKYSGFNALTLIPKYPTPQMAESYNYGSPKTYPNYPATTMQFAPGRN